MEKRRKEISPVDLYRETPKTNCGACGLPTCLAFAVNVIVDRGDLCRCPHLAEEIRREMGEKIGEQQARGVYVRTEKADIADEISRKLETVDLREVAPQIGADPTIDNDEDALRIPLLGRPHTVTRSGRVVREGEEPTPHERILLYNCILRGGGPSPTGRWVSPSGLPGGAPKRQELAEICEEPIAQAYDRVGEGILSRACSAAGGTREIAYGDADRAFRFAGFPRVPLLLLIWGGKEDLSRRARLLVDETAAKHLDTDSLIVLAGLLAEKVLEGISVLSGADAGK